MRWWAGFFLARKSFSPRRQPRAEGGYTTGSVLQGSTANNVVTNIGVSGEALHKLVAEYWNSSLRWSPEDDREAIEADLGVGEDEAAKPTALITTPHRRGWGGIRSRR